MINYLFLFYLPGAAGNFVSRALSLVSDDHYGLVADRDSIRLDLLDRARMLGYANADTVTSWIDFEKKLVNHHEVIDHCSLPTGSCSIWSNHPDYDVLSRGIAGTDDRSFVFYIDPSEAFEWCVLNALFKDSYLQKKWMITGRRMRDDPNIVNINLANIIRDRDSCLDEILKICRHTGCFLNQQRKWYIQDLWDQWNTTTLKPSDFSGFKRQLGFS